MPVARKKLSLNELLPKLMRLSNDSDRLKFLARHRNLLRPKVVEQLAPLVVDKIRVDSREALRLAEIVVLIAQRLRRPEDLALALRAKANALYACGNNRAAVEHHYQALTGYQQWEHAAVALSNMAMCLISLNDFPRSLDCYRRARELCVKYDLPRLRDQADYNIAYLYYFRGEYNRAIGMLFATRRACEKSGDAYHFALCHLDLSEIYLELNLSEEAREMAREGVLLFQKLGMGYEAAKTLANEAIACGQQGNTPQALERFARAREIFAQEKNLVWPWLLDLYQGLLRFHEGRYLEARQLCAGAAEYFDQTPLSGKAVLAHLLLARIALQAGDLATAGREGDAAVAKLSTVQTPMLVYQTHLLLDRKST